MAVKEAGTIRPTARERLLAAANELFYNEGVHTVGIDRVIEQAGVAKASLYNTFGSKDELVRAYLETRQASVAQRITRAVERYDTPRERPRQRRIPPRRPGRAGGRGLPSLGARAADRAVRPGRRPRARSAGPPVAPALRWQWAIRADGPRPRCGRRGSRRRGSFARRSPGTQHGGRRRFMIRSWGRSPLPGNQQDAQRIQIS